jgi:pimeloyl-ACP methyl ester carboxylesterase
MTTNTSSHGAEGKFVRANGIDIHYVEAGSGPPLLLLSGGFLSMSSVWEGFPAAYVSHVGTFAEHFRVIAPDLRGHGKTVHREGKITCEQLVDDMLALIDVLGLARPSLCGFSLGGWVATMMAIREPDLVSALVNHAGHDIFNSNPQAPVYTIARTVFGGSPDATKGDPVATERFFNAHGMGRFIECLKADVDGAQGTGAWKALLANLFDAVTNPTPYTFEDLRMISAPTLILTGDRDMTCTVEEGTQAFRLLRTGELAILPGEGHVVSPSAISTSLAFLTKRTR